MRVRFAEHALTSQRRFPFLFGRAFIEAGFIPEGESGGGFISLPSWKGFH